MKKASETLTPVVLELGGKDAAVVFEDCDYEQFKTNSQRYVFQNVGQNCAGLERVIIHESLYDRYCRDMVEVVSKLRTGPPLLEDVDCGAITMAAQVSFRVFFHCSRPWLLLVQTTLSRASNIDRDLSLDAVLLTIPALILTQILAGYYPKAD
jgi:delta 1-pyrroline-5-carboxylate dehydrogenase